MIKKSIPFIHAEGEVNEAGCQTDMDLQLKTNRVWTTKGIVREWV
jgi:hypothetical protein